jgi:uncharacterized protein (DUF1501 family)
MAVKAFNKLNKNLFSSAGQNPSGNILVTIFLRGGADGLNMVVPVGDRFYYYIRPRIRIVEPSWRSPKSGVDLNGYFALHPDLAPLKQFYKDSSLAVVHAVGLPNDTHSHSEAQDNLEHGTVLSSTVSTGWLARHLASKKVSTPSPLRAVGFSTILPGLLKGYDSTAAFGSLSSFRMSGRLQDQVEYQNYLQTLYNSAGENLGLHQAFSETRQVLSTLNNINMFDFASTRYVDYPQTAFGKSLAETYELINANVGLEVVCLEMGGWDTHANQGSISGTMSRLLLELAQGLNTFVTDLGDRMKNVMIMTISEFGRRAAENGSHGTDHGHGNAMFLLGGGVAGGKVYGSYPTLAPDKLYGPGDLAVTTDYRDVFAEVVTNWLGNPDLASVFPGYTPRPVGVIKTIS